MFWNNLKEYGNNIAIIDSEVDREITYFELDNDAKSIKEKFKIKENSICLILMSNDYSSLAGYLSLMSCDSITMLLSENISEDFLNSLVGNYYPDLIISSNERNLSNYKKEIISKNNIFLNCYYSKLQFENKKTKTKLMLSTSGSTGSSKFVRLSAENIQSNAESIASYLNITQSESAITSLPLNYSFGLSIINSHLLVGATIILTNESVIQKRFWEVFNKYSATTFSGVPYTYQILQRLKFDSMDLPSLRYFTQAGGHLVNNVKEYFLNTTIKKKYEFIVMYGQTEATARISYVPFNRLLDKIDSIGIPIPNGKLNIAFDDNNNIGELIYEGPNVMLGYAESRDDVFKGNELKNILYTGDMGYSDNEGYFYVTGRKKRFLKVFGNRINLDDIERLIENKYGVTCAVTGIDDEILIAVETALGDQLNLIKKNITESLSLHHSAIKIKEIERIPISSNSKKDYQSIKKKFN